MPLEDLRRRTFSVIEKRIKSGTDKEELFSIWNNLKEHVFPYTSAPYPVNHSADHITNVICIIDNLLDATIYEKLVNSSNELENNLFLLFAAALIHDIHMRHAGNNNNQGIASIRKEHADFEKIKNNFKNIHNTTYNTNFDIICLLASCHADSIDENEILYTTNEKIELLNRKHGVAYPFIEYFAKILQFADLLDIRRKRLNSFEPHDFTADQIKHYLKHKYLTVKISVEEKKIQLILDQDCENPKNLSEVCKDIQTQFDSLQIYFYYGWKLILPNIIVDTPTQNINYIPSERRIRIQVYNNCNLKCFDCHMDEYNNESNSNFDEVLTLIKNIKKESTDSNIYPRPNISFTLTGGEPFLNKKYFKDIIEITKSISGEENSTYILTNATVLETDQLNILRENEVHKFRISLNYIDDEKKDNPTCCKIDEEKDKPKVSETIEKFSIRLSNIGLLIEKIKDIEIRINHVLKFGDVDEIKHFKSTIIKNLNNFIPKKIKEIGFIQDTKDSTYNLFEIAKEFCEEDGLTLVNDNQNSRRFFTEINNGLRLSFIKLNCDDNEDIVKRCFDCVQEQDIKITSNGRVRICTEWDKDFKPIYNDVQVNVESPLIAISRVIRKKYAIAGFYGHFPFITKILQGENLNGIFSKIPFSETDLQNLLIKSGIEIDRFSIDIAIKKIIESLLQENSKIRKLYLEGLYGRDELKISTVLCENIIKAAYYYAKQTLNSNNKRRINLLLLIICYLTIDEELFSTGRTIIVRGMAKRLLIQVNYNEYENNSENFLIYSTYCIATIAFENTNTHLIIDYINLMLTNEQQNKSCHIKYLIGCINRQIDEKNKAIDAFSLAFSLSDKEINSGDEQWLKLNKEIRAESHRSLGAIKKKDPRLQKETEDHFLTAQFYSSMDNTELRYASLFSDGYPFLLKFFEDEFDSKSNYNVPVFGYNAYLLLNTSISLNSEFYASLIRIALLDLAFNKVNDALEHLNKARQIFQNKGLLTDQEYLNKILCDYIYLYSRYEAEDGNIDMGEYLVLIKSNIKSCINVGYRDIECIIEDMKILDKIIMKKKIGSKVNRNEFINHIEKFNEQCNNLLPVDYFKKKIKYPVKLIDFHHVCIQTNDYESSLYFYKDLLGCKVIYENQNFNDREHNTWLLAGNTKIELQTPKKGKEFLKWSNDNSGPVHICLLVNDVEKAYTNIKNNNYKNFKKKNNKEELYTVEGKGFKIFKIIAPEGTEVEIRENPNLE